MLRSSPNTPFLKNLFVILFLSLSGAALAQLNIPLNRDYFYRTEANTLPKDSVATHITFKPVVERQSPAVSDPKSLHEFSGYRVCKSGKLRKKLFNESLIIVTDSSTQFRLAIDPLFNLEAGKSNQPREDSFLLYRNTRGLLVRGEIGKAFSFESSFYENQAVYTGYISEFVDSLGVAPGQGRVKKFKSNGYDFAMSSGYISYSPSKHLNLQFGHGKHFVGDGYRSLLLSDNAFNYPYVRITSTFNKFQYTNLYTVFMNLSDGGVITPPYTERLFQKKAGAFQMLSYIPHKRIHLGLFQGMIWEASDNKNRHHLNAWYFNPVIGLSAIPYGLDTKNNILLGATLKAKITKYVYAYSQLMLDEIAQDRMKGALSNKTGWQAGFKAFNLFTLKDLYFQAEYNSVRPYAYSQRRPEQSYTHYNQPLAHPLGANFNEAVGILGYRFTRVFAEIKINYAQAGKDSAGYNFGNDPLASNNFSYYGVSSTVNEQLQGSRTTITNKDLRVGVILNPATNMNLVFGITLRDLENAAGTLNTKYYYVALRTSLSNIYYDF